MYVRYSLGAYVRMSAISVDVLAHKSTIILWYFLKFVCETWWWRLAHHPPVRSPYVFYDWTYATTPKLIDLSAYLPISIASSRTRKYWEAATKLIDLFWNRSILVITDMLKDYNHNRFDLWETTYQLEVILWRGSSHYSFVSWSSCEPVHTFNTLYLPEWHLVLLQNRASDGNEFGWDCCTISSKSSNVSWITLYGSITCVVDEH